MYILADHKRMPEDINYGSPLGGKLGCRKVCSMSSSTMAAQTGAS